MVFLWTWCEINRKQISCLFVIISDWSFRKIANASQWDQNARFYSWTNLSLILPEHNPQSVIRIPSHLWSAFLRKKARCPRNPVSSLLYFRKFGLLPWRIRSYGRQDQLIRYDTTRAILFGFVFLSEVKRVDIKTKSRKSLSAQRPKAIEKEQGRLKSAESAASWTE